MPLLQEENIQHLIFSTLFNVTDLTNGKWPHVYHFDSKARIEAYIRSLGIPASFFMPGFFMSNLQTMLNPSPQPPNNLTWAFPAPASTPIPFFDASEDSGKFVKAMVLKRDQVLGKNVLAATDYYTVQQVLDTFTKVKGKQADFWQVDKETYTGFLKGAGMPEFAAVELYENMSFMEEFGYYGKRSLEWSLSVRRGPGSSVSGLIILMLTWLQLLDEKPTTLDQFLANNKKWDA